MPGTMKTFQLFTAIDNPVPVLIFTVSLPEASNLEEAIRKGDWWADPATPAQQWHLSGVARYDVSATPPASMAAATASKKLYIHTGPTTQAYLIPADQVDEVDAAAEAGGFYTLPSGQRVNWDLVTSYSFA